MCVCVCGCVREGVCVCVVLTPASSHNSDLTGRDNHIMELLQVATCLKQTNQDRDCGDKKDGSYKWAVGDMQFFYI